MSKTRAPRTASRAKRLKKPSARARLSPDHADDQDPVAQFLAECVGQSHGDRVAARKMHEVYSAWALACGLAVRTPKSLAQALKRRGVVSIRSNGAFWINVRLACSEGDFTPGAMSSRRQPARHPPARPDKPATRRRPGPPSDSKAGSLRSAPVQLQLDFDAIDSKRALVTEARAVFGVSAARRLWADLGLPVTGPPRSKPTGSDRFAKAFDRFLAECTEPDDASEVRSGDLYRRYHQWAAAVGGAPPMTLVHFGKLARSRDIPRRKSHTTIYQGLSLRPGST